MTGARKYTAGVSCCVASYLHTYALEGSLSLFSGRVLNQIMPHVRTHALTHTQTLPLITYIMYS